MLVDLCWFAASLGAAWVPSATSPVHEGQRETEKEAHFNNRLGLLRKKIIQGKKKERKERVRPFQIGR